MNLPYNKKEIKEILLNAFGVFTIIQSEIISAYSYLHEKKPNKRVEKRLCSALFLLHVLISDDNPSLCTTDCMLCFE